jgi:predicted permease
MWGQLFDVVAPVIVIASLGYIWARAKLPFDPKMLTPLIMYIGAPCLIVSTLTRLKVTASAFGEVAGVAALAVLTFLVIGYLVLRAARLSVSTYLPGLTLPNVGNMGLPLALFAFGEVGLAYGIAVFTVLAFSQFTIGIALNSGELSFQRLVRTPLIYAVALAMVLMLTETSPPAFIQNALNVLGGMTIPLMLMAMGVALASLKVASMGRSLALSALRLGMGFAVALGLVALFGLEGPARGVIIIQCTMPVAVFNFLFAAHYDNNPEEVAGFVVVSVLMSFLILPFVVAVALDPNLIGI